MNTPAKLGRNLHFSTLAGVENVHLDSEWVVGRWNASLVEIHGPANGTQLHDFLNWRTEPESIVLFTKKHGPLNATARPGAGFRFQLSQWRKHHSAMRSTWKKLDKATGDWEMSWHDGILVYENRQLVYKVRTLLVFLALDIVMRPVNQLKVCRRPGCLNPFFISRHLRQHFCSEMCAGWGQQMAKRKWWAKDGPEWRKKRAKATGHKSAPSKLR
jgi:hypothetical protein